jgi:hypothetical protein
MLLWILFALPTAFASPGDKQPAFESCIGRCAREHHCGQATANYPTDFYLRLLFWSCSDECKYECMHSIEQYRYSHGYAPVQYYGKWPFNRVWGLQELLSVIFSIGNAVPHLLHLFVPKLRARFAPLRDPLRPLLLLCSLMGAFAWWWSTLFHARDFWWTERFDYHCATLLIVSFALQAVGRFGHQIQLHWRWNVLTAVVLAAAFVAHVTHMNVVHFDYGHNMNVNACFVIIQLLVWFLWALKVQGIGALNIFKALKLLFRGMLPDQIKEGQHACIVVLFEISLVSAAAFETGDFPPVWGLLDAHAVWHFLTIPICSVWYIFLHHDAAYRAMFQHTHAP